MEKPDNYLENYRPENFYIPQTKAYSEFKGLFDFGLRLVYESELLRRKWLHFESYTAEQSAIAKIFLKSQNLHISILKLSNEGIRESAGILLRSLFENYINAKYIIKHDLGKRFLEYGYPALQEYFEIIEANSPDSKFLQSQKYANFKNKLNQISKQVRHNYEDKNHRLSNNWSDKHRRQMADDINSLSAYDYIFRLYSAYVHCDPREMYNYEVTTGNEIIFDNSATFDGLEEILSFSSKYFGKIATEWAGIFKMEIPEILKQYLKR